MTDRVAAFVSEAGGDAQAVHQLAKNLHNEKRWLKLPRPSDSGLNLPLPDDQPELRNLWETIEPILNSILREIRDSPRTDIEITEFSKIAAELNGQQQDLFNLLVEEDGWVDLDLIRESGIVRTKKDNHTAAKRVIERLKVGLTTVAPAWTVIVRKYKARLDRV